LCGEKLSHADATLTLQNISLFQVAWERG